uniref:Response regulator n=1 Tax=Roseihalotalea indica TaxID=2867963 RepID=A0AA49GNK0_9BACT|nr:response regulator [Tunicatimonas sp. TK19036]
MNKLKKVWVIDDDPINNIVFKKLSKFTDFSDEIIDFVNAIDALDSFQQILDRDEILPEAIFLDIRMPIVSGWDFMDRLQDIDSPKMETTTIYMLTSSSDQSDIHRAKHHSYIEDYIVKPITVDKLKEIKQRHQQSGEQSE